MLAPLRQVWPMVRRGQRAKSTLVRTTPPPGMMLGLSASRAETRPLVALESTIISHGLPWPLNLETAQACERAVRDAGAEPATIALLDGRVHVGLSPQQLERVARCAEEGNRETATKTGERDIAAVLARGGIGGTTVSATLHLARLAEIEFFATGGIGGVHRGAETSFDISSDLTALARAQGTSVFCSGVKSILAIEQTLEYLETMAVNVMSFNPTGEFPAFYSARSGFFVPPVRGPEAAARIIMRSLDVQQPGANLFAVPIPEKYEAAGEAIARAVEQAVAESVANGMAKRGKEVTPWLLKRVGELSTSSKESNVALVVNNARVAAETAVELQWLRGSKDAKSGRTWSSRRGENGLVFGKPGMPLVRAAGDPDALLSPAQRAVKFERELDARMALGKLEQAAAFGDEIDEETQRNAEKLQQLAEQAAANNYEEPGPQEILVFGGAALDFTTRAHPDETDTRDAIEPSLRETPLGAGPILGDTLPGRMWVNAGGVARNVAEAASRLSASPDAVQLIAPIAEDQQGEMLESALEDAEMRTDGLFVAPGASTATATMMLSSDGSLLRGIIDMDITEQHILPATVSEALALRSQEESHLVAALDCNVSVPTLRAAFSYMTGRHSAVLLVEPTSVVKSRRLISALVPVASEEKQERLRVNICTPTMDELRAMFQAACDEGLVQAKREQTVRSDANPEGAMALQLSRLLGGCLMLVKDGANGVLSARRIDGHDEILHHPAQVLAPGSIVSSSGAGDTFAGCMLALSNESLRERGMHPSAWTQAQLSEAIAISQQAACLSLASSSAISSELDTLWPRIESFLDTVGFPRVLESPDDRKSIRKRMSEREAHRRMLQRIKREAWLRKTLEAKKQERADKRAAALLAQRESEEST